MKKNEKYISYSIVIALMIAFFIAAMCTYFVANDRSMVVYILFGVAGVMATVQIVGAIVYACKKSRNDLDEIVLAYEVVAIIILVVALCIPAFICWVVEKIHDAISAKRRENI